MRRYCIIGPLLLLAILLVPAFLFAEQAQLNGVRHYSHADYTRIVFDLSKVARFSESKSANPDRLYIEIEGASIKGPITGKHRENNLRGITASENGKNGIKLILELSGNCKYKAFALDNPPRIVVDIYTPEAQANSGTTKPTASNANVQSQSIQKPAQKTHDIQKVNIHRVVVDAGHGGKDPGAVGFGIQEKNMTLDLALRVKKILDKEKGYEVILTRSTDVFLSLEERTLIANRKKADLFVSVHINAHTKKSARGIETYMLNWTDDDEAIKVAARENMITFRRMKHARSELGVILASLQLQNKRDESLRLAHYVQDSMVSGLSSKYDRVADLGVKQALFYVLVGADMPSVLVEAAFITNKEESSRLKKDRYREITAQGIAQGIKEYFEKEAPVLQMARK